MRFDELFEMRKLTGIKLKDYISGNGFSKVSFCKKTEISRPTLDKILNGEIDSKSSFDKHFSLYTEIKYEISLFYLKIFFTFCLFCPLLFFSQLHLIPCTSPPFILQRRIMLLRRIDITVSQNICDEVNIAGFTVQIRAVGAAEFMWRDLF